MRHLSEPSTVSGGRRSVRSHILRAAMELFAKEGSRGTPLAAIAERCDVTTPAITHHFGTKQALLMEVVVESDRLIQERFRPQLGLSGMERLVLTGHWVDQLTTDRELQNLSRLASVMVAEALDPEHPAHLHFRARHRDFRTQVLNTIQSGQQDGSIRSDADAETLAGEVVGFMQGLQLQWFLDPDDIEIQTVAEHYFERLLRDLTPLPMRYVRKASTGPKGD